MLKPHVEKACIDGACVSQLLLDYMCFIYINKTEHEEISQREREIFKDWLFFCMCYMSATNE